MSKEEEKIEEILNEYKRDIDIGKTIIDAVLEGINKGIKDGIRTGFIDGLAESIGLGFMGIGKGDIRDVHKDIVTAPVRQGIRTKIKKGTENPLKEHFQGACSNAWGKIKKSDVQLSERDVETTDKKFAKINEEMKTIGWKKIRKEAKQRIFAADLLIDGIFDGLTHSLSDSLDKSHEECRKRRTSELEKK